MAQGHEDSAGRGDEGKAREDRVRETVTYMLSVASGVATLLVGFNILPASTSAEQALICLTAIGMSGAIICGIGAWRNVRRFRLMTIWAALAFVCLAALSVVVKNSTTGSQSQGPASSPSSNSSQSTASQPRAAAFPAVSNDSSSPSATPVSGSVQLVNLSTVSTATDGYSIAPATVDGVTYQNALISDGDICGSYGTVTYQPARLYKHLHALVGVTDNSQSGESVDFSVTVDNNSSPTGTTQTINVGEAPKPIDVDITGAFRITLSAETPDCVFQGTAVWINPVLSE